MPVVARLGIVTLLILAFGSLILLGLRSFQIPFRAIERPPLVSHSSAPTDIGIAYPTSTHICVDGCRAHQNWVEFHITSNTFNKYRLRLKTTLPMAQILTFGIGWKLCNAQNHEVYTCVDMEMSHNLIWMLTTSNLTPLDQLRDPNNWWLEYTLIK